MSINCKVCSKELDVFSGGRCRKCRQLVCKTCTAVGGATSVKGMLCKNCAKTEAQIAQAHGLPAPGFSAPSSSIFGKVPRWAWLSILLIVVVIFSLTIGVPYVKARLHLHFLRTSQSEEKIAAAMEYLGTTGSNYIVRELQYSIEKPEVPERALRTLGKIPTPAVREYLQKLKTAATTSPQLRSIIIEALREQERKMNTETPKE